MMMLDKESLRLTAVRILREIFFTYDSRWPYFFSLISLYAKDILDLWIKIIVILVTRRQTNEIYIEYFSEWILNNNCIAVIHIRINIWVGFEVRILNAILITELQ